MGWAKKWKGGEAVLAHAREINALAEIDSPDASHRRWS
jgi:hypothetical protein